MLGKKIIDVFSIDVSGMRRNELHRDAASLQQIIEFTMMEFSNIKVPFKFIVLQYSEKDMPELSSEVQNIRTIVSNLSKNLSIPLVDTFDSLKVKYVYGKQKIWNGHHTVYGNSLVCAEILKAFSN